MKPTISHRTDSVVFDTDESHPAFGQIAVARWSGGENRLFDSDILHNDTIVITVSHATRHRSNQHDYIHGRDEIVEVMMSMAQWASFVSSMNTTGVPCTLRRYKTGDRVQAPPIDEEPRLALSMRQTRSAAHRAFDDIGKALADVEAALDGGTAKQKRDAIHTLKARIGNAVPNVDYAGRVLIEQTEDTVQKARADIEAMVARHHDRLNELGAGGVELPAVDITTHGELEA